MKKTLAMYWIMSAMICLVGLSACQQLPSQMGTGRHPQPSSPVIEITPLQEGRGQWKVATADIITVTVAAPGAERVQLLSRPENAEPDQFELPALTVPADRERGQFSTQLNLAPDFAAELWAEAFYPGGAKQQTETVAVAAAGEAATDSPLMATGGSVGTNESAHSDKLTGGRIQKTRLMAGESDIRITVNPPAFLLTLWQNGKEVTTYRIGIGRKNFPVPIGEREASRIIFNPYWIPPDSGWVRRLSGVEPYDRVEAGDPRNPLGKIKIPLGSGYLIHAASKEDDLGRAVSHGCIRMRSVDLFDLAEKIITARNLPFSSEQLNRAKQGSERLVVALDAPLLVDINYDLQVVEDGVLHLYPDVYERGAFAVDSLRAELQEAGVDGSTLDDSTLKQMIDRVKSGEQFVIRVADLKRGRLNAGLNVPLTEWPIEKSRYLALARARLRSYRN